MVIIFSLAYVMKTSFKESPFVGHRYVSEFAAANIKLPEGVAEVNVSFTIRLCDGVYKESTQDVFIH